MLLVCNAFGPDRSDDRRIGRRSCGTARGIRAEPGSLALFPLLGLGDAVESALRNHLNCGIVGTLMRGGGIGATLEAFPIPLGSVT
ncbi:MAG: hypothetical protein JWP51_1651 [Bradyrhizobium sp.]|nr:hypothetical protein [Bradyrhizobium sp.]